VGSPERLFCVSSDRGQGIDFPFFRFAPSKPPFVVVSYVRRNNLPRPGYSNRGMSINAGGKAPRKRVLRVPGWE